MLTALNHIILLPLYLIASLIYAGGDYQGQLSEVSHPQGEDLSLKLAEKLAEYQGGLEKVYLNIPLTQLSASDTLHFSAFVVDTEYNAPSDRSLTLYTYLLDASGHTVKENAFFLHDGRAAGYFIPDTNMTDGCYYLTAFTARQQQFSPGLVARQRVEIGETDNAPDFTFTPEGGRIIAGLPVRIDVQCKTPGRISHRKGIVYDDKGRKAGSVMLDSTGAGSFTLRPYQCHFSVAFKDRNGREVRYALPETNESGAALALQEIRGDSVARVAVMFTHHEPASPVYLVVAQQNRLLVHRAVRPVRQNLFDIPLSSPTGDPLRIALLDSEGKPLSAIDLPVRDYMADEIGIDSDAHTGSVSLASPEGEALQGQFSLTAWTDEQPFASSASPFQNDDPLSFWSDLQQSDLQLGALTADYESCRLLLLDKKGRPAAGKELKIEGEDYHTILWTSAEGMVSLPNYRLEDPLTVVLPGAHYSLMTHPSNMTSLFLKSLGGDISGTDHTECSHSSHAEPKLGNVSLENKGNGKWTVSKYQVYPSHTTCKRHLVHHIMWQASTCTDTKGSLNLPIPDQWKDRPVHLRLTGFTDEGWYIDREILLDQ